MKNFSSKEERKKYNRAFLKAILKRTSFIAGIPLRIISWPIIMFLVIFAAITESVIIEAVEHLKDNPLEKSIEKEMNKDKNK